MICGPAVNALSSTAYVKIPAVAAVGGFAASLVAWLLFIPRLGIAGVALGFVIGAVVTGGVPACFAARLLGAPPAAFLRASALVLSLVLTLFLVGRTPLLTSVIFVGVVTLLYAGPGRRALSRAPAGLPWPRRREGTG
jgi:O-antigen/teichoic acid export membrane protein